MNWYKIAQSQGWQDGWQDDLGDIQRYSYDAYSARVFITKLGNEKITVSVGLFHLLNGTCMWQDFWRFKSNEVSKAKSTYAKVKNATEEVFQKFRTNDIPNPMLHTHMRESVRFIDIEHKPTSRIPFVDWARSKECVKDWRSSLYGNRYPESDGF